MRQVHSPTLIARPLAYRPPSLGTLLLAYESSLSAFHCLLFSLFMFLFADLSDIGYKMSMDFSRSTHVPLIALLSTVLLLVLSMAAFMLAMLLILVVSTTIRILRQSSPISRLNVKLLMISFPHLLSRIYLRLALYI